MRAESRKEQSRPGAPKLVDSNPTSFIQNVAASVIPARGPMAGLVLAEESSSRVEARQETSRRFAEIMLS